MQFPICISLQLYKSESVIIQGEKPNFRDMKSQPKQTTTKKKGLINAMAILLLITFTVKK